MAHVRALDRIMSKVADQHTSLPDSLYRAEQVRELDRIAIEERGIPGHTLMERAGAAAFYWMHRLWPEAREITVVCGIGNNGGDGYVVARLALKAGLSPRVLQQGDPERLSGDASTCAEAYKQLGGSVEAFAGIPEATDLIVDALFGTGLERPVEGGWAQVLEAMNTHPAPIYALDLPSGLHSDTGQVMGVAVKAEASISFIGLKQGMFTAQGPDYCGQVLFDDLQVPAATYTSISPSAERIDWDGVKHSVIPRTRSAHKGDYGSLLLIGGDVGFSGAIFMAAEAAARVGAGLVRVATRQQHAQSLVAARPEVMWQGVEQAEALAPLLRWASVVVIGPGLGQEAWGKMLFMRAIESDLPMVVDADALNLLAQEPVRKNNWILTPHPGEAARLLNCTVAEIEADRFNAARQIQVKFGGCVVLKGAGTLVVGEDQISVCSDGNPGMATGGMGDVLTGIIGSLWVQGFDNPGRLGVAVHAAAGDLVAHEGERGMLATDLMPVIRQLVNPEIVDV